MGKTAISWTDVSWNPIRGCTRVSAGCVHCYAEAMAARFSGHGQPFEGFAERTKAGGRWTGKLALIESKLREPLSWREPKKVFVNSMSDLWHESLDMDAITKVYEVMTEAARHTFQVLTKRPDRRLQWLKDWTEECDVPIPPNVWEGTSIESRKELRRLDFLRETPAAIRFLSLEPLLEDLGGINLEGVRWVIAGGESGPGHRPMRLEWAADIRDQCRAAGVAFWFKQVSGPRPGQGSDALGSGCQEFPC